MFAIPKFICEILDTLHINGFEAYVVGGAVRDMLLGKNPSDFDITTSCPPEITATLFKKTINTGIKHGTVTVVTECGNVEVTTYRRDKSYKNHRKPNSVDFISNLYEDLKRRDFTINAFALSKSGEIIDNFDGSADLNNKIIRAVGIPSERFCEDALRILRAFRFSSRLNFDIEPTTLKAALDNAHLLSTLSAERIFSELKQILLSDFPEKIEPLINNGGLKHLSVNFVEGLSVLKNCPHELRIRFFVFCQLIKANPAELCLALKTDNELLKYCTTMQALVNKKPVFENVGIKNALNLAGEKILKDYISLPNFDKNSIKDEILKQIDTIIATNQPYTISQLNVSGNDIINLSVSGKDVGTVLEFLLEKVIENPELNNKESLIALAKEFIISKFTI